MSGRDTSVTWGTPSAPLYTGLMRHLASVLSAAALIAGTGSLGCAAETTTDAGTPGTVAATGAAQVCVDTINGYRATLKLPALVRWTDQESCAGDQAGSDAQSQKAHGAFGNCGEFAQNECPDWPGRPEQLIRACLKAMWEEGPGADFQSHGHYLNMSSTKFTKVACGFRETGAGKLWSVQDFR